MRFNPHSSISILLLVALVGCGGGGGGDIDTVTDVDSNNNTDVRNSGLEEKLFFTHNDEAYIMDAATGEYSRIPNTDWVSQRDRFKYPGVTFFFTSTIKHDNTEFLLVGAESSESTICMQSYTGDYLGQFNLPEKVLSGSISQDHQYIALFRRIGSVSSTPWFELYRRDGSLIADAQIEEKYILWLQDNRMLYAVGRTFYFTKPVSTEIDYSLTLPDSSVSSIKDGKIGHIELSPNESQIIFTIAEKFGTMFNGPKNSRLYIMNSDGSDLRLLATTYNDYEPSIFDTTWSPDGRWIMISEGYLTPSSVGDNDLGYVYIVPTDNLTDVFYLSPNENERSKNVKLFNRRNLENDGYTSHSLGIKFRWIQNP